MPGARETVEMLYEFEQPFVVDGSRFSDAFGLTPTPLVEALHRTLAWYRDQSL
jgi:nucleoside-diphosphate-sugar epimerase